jgi:hypothetical protein
MDSPVSGCPFILPNFRYIIIAAQFLKYFLHSLFIYYINHSPFSIGITISIAIESIILDTLHRKEIYLAHSSGGSRSLVPATAQDLIMNQSSQ